MKMCAAVILYIPLNSLWKVFFELKKRQISPHSFITCKYCRICYRLSNMYVFQGTFKCDSRIPRVEFLFETRRLQKKSPHQIGNLCFSSVCIKHNNKKKSLTGCRGASFNLITTNSIAMWDIFLVVLDSFIVTFHLCLLLFCVSCCCVGKNYDMKKFSRRWIGWSWLIKNQLNFLLFEQKNI